MLAWAGLSSPLLYVSCEFTDCPLEFMRGNALGPDLFISIPLRKIHTLAGYKLGLFSLDFDIGAIRQNKHGIVVKNLVIRQPLCTHGAR